MVRGFIGCLAALMLLTSPDFADDLPALSGPVLLTVTGLDRATYPTGKAEFDLPMLQALGSEKITTGSIWTDGKHEFTGVPLQALEQYLSITGPTLSLHALNDYAVQMPAAEVEPGAPILAYMMDGAVMPIRDKGPIWLIYPYDSAPRYRTDTFFSRSVWQLDRIDVLR